jgi:site-specific DNA recombinase
LVDLAPRIKELRTRQEKLLARKVELETLLSDRRVELASPAVVRRYVADLRNLLKRSELAERKAFIRNFVREVRVTGDEVVLTYTMPLVGDGSFLDRMGVLPIVQHGRPCRSRTCDTLIKSHGVSNQRGKEVKWPVLTP